MKKIYTEKDFVENFDNLEKVKHRKLEDFYCNECGDFLIGDEEVIRFVVENLKGIVNKGTILFSPSNINSKQYYRVKCFKCFEEKYGRPPKALCGVGYDLCFLLDIPEEEIKKHTMKRVPTLKNYIKRYGEEEGTIRFNIFRDKSAVTLDNFIIRYGEEKGTIKWDDYVEQQRFGSSPEGYIDRYGSEEGKKRWNEKNLKIAEGNNLEGHIKKYGKVEGTRRYEELCKSKAVSLENFIKKYGEVSGKKKHKEYCKLLSNNSACKLDYFLNKGLPLEEAKEALRIRQDNISFDSFIRKHGEIEGKKRFIAYQEKSSLGYSKTSQILFDDIWCKIKDDFNRILYATLNSELFLRNDEGIYFYDFAVRDNNKIIEFNGDYWHANPKLYESEEIISYPGQSIKAKELWVKDEVKNNHARNKGYEVLVIWEYDFNNNYDEILDECLKFIYN